MARLKDLPIVVRRIGVLTFLTNVWKEVGKDNIFTFASALAYSWLFAIFPFFIFLLSLLPYLPDQLKEDAQVQIFEGVRTQLSHDAATTLLSNLEPLLNQPKTSLLSIGLLITIWAASGGMAMTMAAMDAAYDCTKPRPFYRQRSLAVLLTIIVASLVISVLLLGPIGTIAIKIALEHSEMWLHRVGVSNQWLAPLVFIAGFLRYALALSMMMLVLAILHKWGTAAPTRFQFFSPGAIFSVIVWIGLGFVFRLYIDKYGKYEKTYGTVGGVAILLLFFYIDALVLLTGAEINAEIDAQLKIDSHEDKTPAEIAADRPETVNPLVEEAKEKGEIEESKNS